MRNRDFEDEDEDDVDCGSIRRRVPVNQRRPIEYYDDDEDDEDEEDIASFRQRRAKHHLYSVKLDLVNLLDDIEQERRRLHGHLKELQALLKEEPELAAMYAEFQQKGGVIADDLRRFFSNKQEPVRPRITYSRKHLRLVSTNKPVKRSRPRLREGNDGDDAA